MTRLAVIAALCCTAIAQASAAELLVEVFGLFAPTELTVAGEPLIVSSAGHDHPCLQLQASYRHSAITFRCGTTQWEATSASVQAQSPLTTTVPDKISRQFPGSLRIDTVAEHLRATVTFPLEDAVAAAVAAEMPSEAPAAALEAQAIAARSYYLASRHRHPGGSFCDTTHCQFLRAVPPPDHPASIAARRTAGLALTWNGQPIDAQYSRRCGGQTRSAVAANGFPYTSVACKICRGDPQMWQTELPPAAASQIRENRTERARIEIVRALGWDALPSLDFQQVETGRGVVLEGRGQGHGLGLCQYGAIGMAKRGATAFEILAHYYPRAALTPR